MRRLRFAPLSLLLLAGCWNFEALQDKGVNNNGDMTGAGVDAGMVACKAANPALTEVCNDGVDNNDDCLVDCNDPLCTGSLSCVDPMKQLIGYGNKVGAGGTCAMTATDVFASATPNADCSTGCGCTGSCSAVVRGFTVGATCTAAVAATEQSKTAVTSNGTQSCTAVNMQAAGLSYLFEAGNPLSACPVDNAKKGTLGTTKVGSDRLCTQPAGSLDTVQKLANTSALCLAFTGDIACPAQFPTKTTYFTSLTDGRTCTCACAVGGNSCQLSGNSASVFTSNNCGAGPTKLNAPAAPASCINPGGTQMSIAFTATPTCTPSGTAPIDAAATALVVPGGKVTSCCK